MTTAPLRVSAPASPLGWRPTVALLVAVVVVTVVVAGLAIGVGRLVPGAHGHLATLLALTLPAHSLAVLAVLHVGLRRAGSGWRALGFTRPTRGLLHLLWQAPVVLLAVLAAQGLVFALDGAAVESSGGIDDVADAVGPLAVVSMLLSAVVLVPVWEEAVFRGLVLGGLRRRWTTPLAVLGSAVCFGAAHAVPTLMPYLVTLGVGLAVLRLVHRTLWASVVVHAAVNTLASLALFSAVLT